MFPLELSQLLPAQWWRKCTETSSPSLCRSTTRICWALPCATSPWEKGTRLRQSSAARLLCIQKEQMATETSAPAPTPGPVPGQCKETWAAIPGFSSSSITHVTSTTRTMQSIYFGMLEHTWNGKEEASAKTLSRHSWRAWYGKKPINQPPAIPSPFLKKPQTTNKNNKLLQISCRK